MLSVIYQSYFSQKFNNRNLTVIVSFSLFQHSWSASFSHLPSRAGPKQQMVCLCAAAGSTPLHPPFSPGTVRASLCVRLCLNAHDFQLPFRAFCCSGQKAGKLGTLSSNEPRCPAVIQFSSQSPCWSSIHSQPQIKE